MRLRSRLAETGDVNQRRLGRGSVSRSAVQPRAIGALEQLPGSQAPKYLAPGTVESLDGRFAAGETVTLTATVNSAGWVTWDSEPLHQLGFSRGVPVASVAGYYDVYLDVAGTGPMVDLEVRAAASGMTRTETCPFATTWRGVLPNVDTQPGDEIAVYVDPGGQAATVVATVGLVEQTAPTAALELAYVAAASDYGSVTGTLDLTHTAPAGTQVGDLLVVSWVGRSLQGLQGTDGAMTADSAFTVQAHHSNGGTTTDRFQTWVLTKVADATDAAQGRTYTWAHPNSYNYASVTCMALRPSVEVSSITAATDFIDDSDGTTQTLSVTAPDATQTFAILTARTTRTTYDGVNPSFTAGVDTVEHSYNPTGGTNVTGAHHAGFCTPGSTVTGTTGVTHSVRHAGLVVLGLS